MEHTEVKEELNKIIAPILEENGFELIELSYFQSRSSATLKIFTDRYGGGITVEDCAYLNRKIAEALDAVDIIQERYFLEVSSPGIDRPLKTKNDFLRNKAKLVKFFLREAINGKIEVDGEVLDADEQTVKIKAKGASLDIALSNIIKAKQII